MVSRLKKIIKIFLSRIYFLVRPTKRDGYLSIPGFENLFFGYFDLSPFSNARAEVIFHAQRVGTSDSVEIVVYDLEKHKYKSLGETRAWNYQQGARLTWFGEREVLFNVYDAVNETYMSKIVNVDDGTERYLPVPMQAIHEQDFILSLDYEHLDHVSEYGYRYRESRGNPDSVLKLDLTTNLIEELVCQEDCDAALKGRYRGTSKHFIHLTISPNGSFASFIYRFYCDSRRVDHLFAYSFTGQELKLLIEDELISHCVWSDHSTLIFWGVVKQARGYYSYDLIRNKRTMLYETRDDGHPVMVGRDAILTDTYPDLFSRQRLYYLDLKTNQKKLILEAQHPVIYEKSARCDLHPSISASRERFQVDLMHGNRRQVCIRQLDILDEIRPQIKGT